MTPCAVGLEVDVAPARGHHVFPPETRATQPYTSSVPRNAGERRMEWNGGRAGPATDQRGRVAKIFPVTSAPCQKGVAPVMSLIRSKAPATSSTVAAGPRCTPLDSTTWTLAK